jgi:hypothetical protein
LGLLAEAVSEITYYYDIFLFFPPRVLLKLTSGRNLSVLYDTNSISGEPGENWFTCFAIPATLPIPGFFGVSAATGDVTDHHDVVSLTAYA